MSARGTCGGEQLQVRALLAVLSSFFPFATITKVVSSTLHQPFSQIHNLTLEISIASFSNFQYAAATLCKDALFQSTESSSCSRGLWGFATLLLYLQPGILLLCVKAAFNCCISVYSVHCLLTDSAQFSSGRKQNRILTPLITTAGTMQKPFTSHRIFLSGSQL